MTTATSSHIEEMTATASSQIQNSANKTTFKGILASFLQGIDWAYQIGHKLLSLHSISHTFFLLSQQVMRNLVFALDVTQSQHFCECAPCGTQCPVTILCPLHHLGTIFQTLTPAVCSSSSAHVSHTECTFLQIE